MAFPSRTFVDFQGNIPAEWLNAVNEFCVNGGNNVFSTLYVDTIRERTANNGISLEGVTIKGGVVDFGGSSIKVNSNGFIGSNVVLSNSNTATPTRLVADTTTPGTVQLNALYDGGNANLTVHATGTLNLTGNTVQINGTTPLTTSDYSVGDGVARLDANGHLRPTQDVITDTRKLAHHEATNSNLVGSVDSAGLSSLISDNGNIRLYPAGGTVTISGDLAVANVVATSYKTPAFQYGFAPLDSTNKVPAGYLPPIGGSGTLGSFDRLTSYTGGSISVESPLSIGTDITLTGNNRKIFANMTDPAPARMLFQSSVVNGATYIAAAPNGAANNCRVILYNSSDLVNNTYAGMGMVGTEFWSLGGNLGTGAACSVYKWGPSGTTFASINSSGLTTLPGSLAIPTGGVQTGGNTTGYTNVNSTGIRYLNNAATNDKWLSYLVRDASGNITQSNNSIPLNVFEGAAQTNSVLGGVSSNSADIPNTAWVRALVASDKNIKTNLTPVGSTLDKLADITAYTYDQEGYNYRKLGTIAQDWKKHWPEVTPTIIYEDVERLSIEPLSAIAILTQAINELNTKLSTLSLEKQQLEARVTALESAAKV